MKEIIKEKVVVAILITALVNFIFLWILANIISALFIEISILMFTYVLIVIIFLNRDIKIGESGENADKKFN